MLRKSFLGAALIALALTFLVACSSSSKKGTAESSQAGASSGNTITGAGSTFVYPIMSRWIANFQQGNPGVQINYQSIGSGGGIQQLKKGLVDFGASDAALSDEKLKDMPPIIQLPESAGPVCITYNLPDLKQPLKLTPEALAGIYLGTVKTWHDPLLRKANPGVNLPNSPVLVVHRSDGSGTTNIFTTYLNAVSPDWKQKVGEGISVNWPVGLGGKGSEGVTGLVKQSPGSIGYVELTYADENNLPVAVVENKAGNFVKPSAEGTTAAIDAFSKELQQDVRNPIVNPPATAKEAYPISGLTFLMVPKNTQNTAKQQEVKKFINYIITQGQDQAEQLHYAKLPESLVKIDQQKLEENQAGGGTGTGQ